MRAVLQRVTYGSVSVDNKLISEIERGLVILVGFQENDNDKILQYMFNKIINLRIFEDKNQKLNKSLIDITGEILIVPQFTLYADCKKGRRPSFTKAAPIEKGKELFDKFIKLFQKGNITFKSGSYKKSMLVKIHNMGPVTIILNSDELCR